MLDAVWNIYFYKTKILSYKHLKTNFVQVLQNLNVKNRPWKFSTCKSTYHSDAEIPWSLLLAELYIPFEKFFAELEPINDITWSISDLWANIYETGDYQEIHDHTHSISGFSFIFMLQKSEEDLLVFESPLDSLINLSSLSCFKKYDSTPYRPVLEEGEVLIFPNWIKHYVLPNTGNITRMSITGNININT